MSKKNQPCFVHQLSTIFVINILLYAKLFYIKSKIHTKASLDYLSNIIPYTHNFSD